jgi:hypothetical protein
MLLFLSWKAGHLGVLKKLPAVFITKRNNNLLVVLGYATTNDMAVAVCYVEASCMQKSALHTVLQTNKLV